MVVRLDSTWDDLVTDGGTVDAWATVDAVKAEKGGDFALDDVSPWTAHIRASGPMF
eukprot:COSAG05_NODE_24307_length_252_cov_0.686275_1_plen_56_part_00